MDAVRRIADRVAAEPVVRDAVPPRALIVGGFVRDALLGRETLDVDLEVFGVPVERLEALLAASFPGRVSNVGRSFGIFKAHVAPGVDVDVALPRTESKAGDGHRGFEVTGDPSSKVTFKGWQPETIAAGLVRNPGIVATATHCVSAIPYVCRADPGLKTYLDLPLIAGRADPRLAR